jgi:hypothetical protein
MANVAAPEYEMYPVKMYKNGANLRDFLDAVMQDDNGRAVMMEWMRLHAIAQVCTSVQSEMYELDKEFRSEVMSITPAYVRDWTMEKDTITPVKKITPLLLQVIRAAVASRQTEKNRNKDTTRVCATYCWSTNYLVHDISPGSVHNYCTAQQAMIQP